jgi:4-azaleucine resistance transporter AzlC
VTDRREVTSTSWEVGIVVGSYGIGFGALAVANGLTVLQAVAMSVLVFTGASQFALVGVIGAGGAPASGVAAALALGTRNAFYGLRMREILQVTGWRRFAAAHLTIDESTAVGLAQRTPELSRLGFWTTGLVVFTCWNVATVVGALAVEQIADPRVIGLDAAVGAAFLALIWPQLTTRASRQVMAGAVLLTLALTPVLPAGVPVLAAASIALVVAWPEPRPAGRADGAAA